jgi:hypothetical protein
MNTQEEIRIRFCKNHDSNKNIIKQIKNKRDNILLKEVKRYSHNPYNNIKTHYENAKL